MNVTAIIVEQLEPDGRIKRLTMRGSTPQFEIAFPDEFVGDRSGPFFFPNPDDEKLFKKSFAKCNVLTLTKDSFQEINGMYKLTIERGGIPTEQGQLTYYSLLLPEYAVLREVVVKNARSNEELFKSVYKDGRRNRFIIYVECASQRPRFDFLLEARLRIEKNKFTAYVYADVRQDDFINKYGKQVTAYERRLSPEYKKFAREFFSGNGKHSANGRALTAQDVAKLLNMHPVTVYKLAASGRLPSFKVGYSLRFHRERIEALMKNGGSRRTE